jgi:hypothetical protein
MILASATATILAAAISAAAGLSGVGAGILATTHRERFARREAAKRDLNVAALRCLARANKIETADKGGYAGADEDRRNEINLLGPDLDAYVVAIAAVEDPATRARHWAIYEQAGPILIGQRTEEELGRLIEALEQIRKDLVEAAPQ